MEIPPESKSGGKQLTSDEDDEYSQIQGNGNKNDTMYLL